MKTPKDQMGAQADAGAGIDDTKTRDKTKKGKKDAEKPRGPIPMKRTGRSLSLDDD